MPKLTDEELIILLRQIASSSTDTFRSLTSLDKKLDLHIQKTEFEMGKIHEMDALQNRLLDQHIEGVNTLRKIYEAHEIANNQRFEAAEAPRIWVRIAFKIFLTVGAISSAIAGVMKLFHLI